MFHNHKIIGKMKKQYSLETQASFDSPSTSCSDSPRPEPRVDTRLAKNAIAETVSESILKFRKKQFIDLLYQNELTEEEYRDHQRLQLNKNSIKAEIRQFLSKFDELNVDTSCFVYCLMLYKKTLSKRKKSAKNDSFLVLLKTCLFVALKYVLDDTLVMLKDFSEHAEIDSEVLECLEITLLTDVLKFEVNFSEQEYKSELSNISEQMC